MRQRNGWKLSILILGALMLSGAGVYVFSLQGPNPKSQGHTMQPYKAFEAKNPVFDFTFEYPGTGWLPVETSGSVEKYDQVYLRGPVNQENGFTTLMHVTVRPLEAGKTPQDLLEDYLKMDSNLPRFKVLRKTPQAVGQEKAVSALYEYESFPLFSMKAPSVVLRGQRVYFIRDGRSYEFMLTAIASQYGDYAPLFEHLLKTFKFKK